MANTGTFKQLPWPQNLWKELFGFSEFAKPPEDWEQALQVFMDTLSELEQRILLAWYRDKKTGKQMQAEFQYPGVVSKRAALVDRMRRDWDNRNIYKFGPAKAKLIPSIRRGLLDGLGMSAKAADDTVFDIITNTNIAQMTAIESKLSSLPYGAPENRMVVEVLLNTYGLTTLCSRKMRYSNHCRNQLLDDMLEIINQLADREALLKRISDTFMQSMSVAKTPAQVMPVMQTRNHEALFKILTGGDGLDLLCKAGVVKLQVSETGQYIWAVVQRADALPPLKEEVGA